MPIGQYHYQRHELVDDLYSAEELEFELEAELQDTQLNVDEREAADCPRIVDDQGQVGGADTAASRMDKETKAILGWLVGVPLVLTFLVNSCGTSSYERCLELGGSPAACQEAADLEEDAYQEGRGW